MNATLETRELFIHIASSAEERDAIKLVTSSKTVFTTVGRDYLIVKAKELNVDPADTAKRNHYVNKVLPFLNILEHWKGRDAWPSKRNALARLENSRLNA